jgi:hypothetical protein
MSTKNSSGGEGRPARKADNLTAICEPIVYKMWDPQHLTTLWVSTAPYRDTFTFTLHIHYKIYCFVLLIYKIAVWYCLISIDRNESMAYFLTTESAQRNKVDTKTILESVHNSALRSRVSNSARAWKINTRYAFACFIKCWANVVAHRKRHVQFCNILSREVYEF